ncbi:hypothetical protein BD769DRAFT_1428254 [Suillus cothurnatus]|nr:hypothetical protein BD769DRAFT_1428254 [Suillus cothurnatus]
MSAGLCMLVFAIIARDLTRTVLACQFPNQDKVSIRVERSVQVPFKCSNSSPGKSSLTYLGTESTHGSSTSSVLLSTPTLKIRPSFLFCKLLIR